MINDMEWFGNSRSGVDRHFLERIYGPGDQIVSNEVAQCIFQFEALFANIAFRAPGRSVARAPYFEKIYLSKCSCLLLNYSKVAPAPASCILNQNYRYEIYLTHHRMFIPVAIFSIQYGFLPGKWRNTGRYPVEYSGDYESGRRNCKVCQRPSASP